MEEIYDPKMNQREFMLKALQSEDKLKPRNGKPVCHSMRNYAVITCVITRNYA
jgi:hypothetical protein